MYIHTEAAASAVAIAVGMKLDSYFNHYMPIANLCNMGGIEFYTEIGKLAAISAAMANEVADCPEFKGDGFPGIYAYEVDEEIGEYIRARTLGLIGTEEQVANKGTFDLTLAGNEEVMHRLGMMALTYFEQVGKPIPLSAAIIEKHTGYTKKA